MTGKILGKIVGLHYGFGGYQDAQFGLSVTLGGEGYGVSDFWGFWATRPGEHCKWTEEQQIKSFGETAMRIKEIMVEAKVDSLDKLKGAPVEITFDDGTLKEWRILKEVL